jgi:hypothetical protein
MKSVTEFQQLLTRPKVWKKTHWLQEPCKEASWKATKGGDVCIAWGRCIGIPTLYLTANEETKTVQTSHFCSKSRGRSGCKVFQGLGASFSTTEGGNVCIAWSHCSEIPRLYLIATEAPYAWWDPVWQETTTMFIDIPAEITVCHPPVHIHYYHRHFEVNWSTMLSWDK